MKVILLMNQRTLKKVQKHKSTCKKVFFKTTQYYYLLQKKKKINKKKFSNINSNTATEVKVATEPKFLSEIKHE